MKNRWIRLFIHLYRCTYIYCDSQLSPGPCWVGLSDFTATPKPSYRVRKAHGCLNRVHSDLSSLEFGSSGYHRNFQMVNAYGQPSSTGADIATAQLSGNISTHDMSQQVTLGLSESSREAQLKQKEILRRVELEKKVSATIVAVVEEVNEQQVLFGVGYRV